MRRSASSPLYVTMRPTARPEWWLSTRTPRLRSAHVPAQDAGPTPLQVGPFTYERLVQSAGRATLRGPGKAKTGVFVLLVGIVVFGAVAVVIVRLVV